MARRRRKRPVARPPVPEPLRRARPLEERLPTEWLTVAWLLTALTAAACLALWGLAQAGAWFVPALSPLAGFLLFAALVTGGVNLLLCAAAHALRRAPPPRPLLWFSLAVGLLPIMLLWLH